MSKIRKFMVSDAKKYYEICNSSGDIARYVPGLVEDSEQLCELMVQGFVNANFVDEFAFAITDELDDSVIGAIVASREYACNSINVAYFVGIDNRRKGIIQKALETFTEFCKKETTYWSIYFDVIPSNVASTALVKKIGAKEIGEFYYLDHFIRYELIL